MTSTQPKLLTFSSGGWILLVAVILCAAAVGWILVRGKPAVGNGRDLSTYGFDLSHLAIPAKDLTAALPKDTVVALTDPETSTLAGALASNHNQYIRYLHDETRVIGVTLGGQSRCYPLPIMQLHEICNDTLAGTPIVITYSPLTDSVVVARRTVGGQRRVFGSSGLLVNDNSVLYDRQSDSRAESLWSQLQWRAIAGPAAGTTLELVPCQLVTWKAWRTAHPATTVITGRADLAGEYPRQRYESYLASADIPFPVHPLWSDPVRAPKTPIAAVRHGDTWNLYVLHELANLPAAQRDAVLAKSPVPLTFDAAHATLAADPSAHADVIYSLLFAWYAAHPDATRGYLLP